MNSLEDETVLDRALTAVADSMPIEWDQILAGSPSMAPRLSRLRVLHRVASTFRRGADSLLALPEAAAAPVLFRWGSLRVLEKIDEGGFGEVYRAFDPMLEREVALKLERQASLGSEHVAASERTRRAPAAVLEARRLAKVRHPNVLAVYGADIQEGRVGIWTDLLRGRTLEERLRVEGPLDGRTVSLIGLDLCRALAAVHAAGLVHGDVKAKNVMQEEDGRIVLLDFGSGRSFATPDPREPRTGTPLNLSLEVLRGENPGPSDDLYALGVLLYRLASNRYPIQVSSMDELLREKEAGRWDPLAQVRPDVPQTLARVVERALLERDRRFASAAEMERALADSLLEGEGSPSTGPARHPEGNLPAPVSRFIGRKRALSRIRQLLGSKRLITLTGTGGVGKSRLAIEVASLERHQYAGGVWFVELAPIHEASEIAAAVLQGMGRKEEPKLSLEESLLRSLPEDPTLLILDNCEHLRDACAGLAERLLQANARLRILVTSREDLGLAGEALVHVAPLSVPAREKATPRELARVESVALFMDRAAAVHPGLAISAATAPAVARICRSLEGIPLALELAASRARALPVEEIARRLEDRLTHLEGRGGTAPDRHRTLLASIEWSFVLLSHEERSLFRKLAVFSGGWSLEAAEDICASPAEAAQSLRVSDAVGDAKALRALDAVGDAKALRAEIVREDVINLMTGLVGKSMVERDGRARYRMLEALRQYARERCLESGEWTALARRHRDYFLRLAEEAAGRLTGPEQSIWLARLNADHDNLRAALESFMGEDADPEQALRMAGALGRFWVNGRHWRTARAVCETLKEHPGAQAPSAARAGLLAVAGDLATRRRDVAEASACLNEALEIFRRLEDAEGTALTLGGLANLALGRGDYEGARALFEESLALRRKIGDPWPIASVTLNLGMVAFRQGRLDEAEAAFEESLRTARSIGHDWGVSAGLNALASVKGARGDHAGSCTLFREGLVILRRLDARSGVASCLHNLGTELVHMGELEEGRACYEEGIAICHELQDQRGEFMSRDCLAQLAASRGEIALARRLHLESLDVLERLGEQRLLSFVLTNLGQVAIQTGDPARALKLICAGAGIRDRMGSVLGPMQQQEISRLKEEALGLIGAQAAEEIEAEWTARSLAEALALAREQSG